MKILLLGDVRPTAVTAPSKSASISNKLGVNCCGLSNNHIFDYGCDLNR
ncbi:MAG: hypothetical protein IJ470_02600 [Clostridia bacterium]|nr:hypothetical protein [Clostridia bacterium]